MSVRFVCAAFNKLSFVLHKHFCRPSCAGACTAAAALAAATVFAVVVAIMTAPVVNVVDRCCHQYRRIVFFFLVVILSSSILSKCRVGPCAELRLAAIRAGCEVDNAARLPIICRFSLSDSFVIIAHPSDLRLLVRETLQSPHL